MRVQILDEAQRDLVEGSRFYESQGEGLGDYFLNSLFSDIDSLQLYAGVHPVYFGYNRLLSKRFPFAIYYRVENEMVRVYAVLDCRREPSWTRIRLS